MTGKITVKAKNPPCTHCGGMAGYHYRDCAAKPACAHIVNPATDRCVMCGKNRFNRELEAAQPAEERK